MRNGFRFGLVLAIGLVLGNIESLPAIAQEKQDNLWNRVYRSLFGGQPPVPKGAGGSRPLQQDAFCSVVPGQWGQEKPFMLRSRPIWIWRGDVKSIQLENAGNTIWQQSGNVRPEADGLTRVIHTGPLLEPGKNYRLVIKRSNGLITYANFQTIELEARSRLMFEQNQVDELAWRSGKRGTALVQDQVSFLTQQGLWLDMVQAVLINNSTEWRDVRTGIVSETCDQPFEKINP